MHWTCLVLGVILILTAIDLDSASKHHRNRGGKDDQESLLDKHEREKEKKDRKKDEETKKEENRNITCYKCDGDLCRDPLQTGYAIPTVQCEHSCWKGVFVSSVRRSCGNKRCGLSFQGSSAISNTCCQTPLCNKTSMKIPSIIYLSNEYFPQDDEFGDEIMNMSKSLHMNSPEGKMYDSDINNENKRLQRKLLIEQLHSQLVHNQLQRTQPRDYLRILHQSNTPAYWYKTPTPSRSVYFYDRNYQKQIQQPVTTIEKPKVNVKAVQSKPIQTPRSSSKYSSFVQKSSLSMSPRPKHTIDTHRITTTKSFPLKQSSCEHYHPPSPNFSQRYPSAQSRFSTLPPINIIKQEYNLLNINENEISNHQPIINESRKNLNPIVVPSAS
ncbi:unnamed protein product [Adineta steineri]|uniref:Uncharacterized protein n=1 Tax=Adineta steineri TaxID=433720 RepID=A0A814MVZ1_9BILA|nr:unnamed protein product [Adineta steineri]